MLFFIVAAGIFTMTPGLDTAMVLRTSTGEGAAAGKAVSVGICIGLWVWGMSAAFGLTALLAASQLAYNVVKWAGAAYLLYLGISLLVKPRSTAFDESDAVKNSGSKNRHKDFLLRGFFSNILNPKVGLFYVTFLPQFIPHEVNVARYSLMLAAIHVVITLAWFWILVALTATMRHFLSRSGVVRTLDRMTGCIFVGFGLKLAVSRN